MSLEGAVRPLVIEVSGQDVDLALSTSSCQDKAVLPGSPLYRVDRRISFDLIDQLPVIDLHFLPNPDASVVPTCRYHIFELWVSPADLPAGAGVGREDSWLLHHLIILDLVHPYLSIAVTSCKPSSVEVKLGISLNKREVSMLESDTQSNPITRHRPGQSLESRVELTIIPWCSVSCAIIVWL